MFRIKICGITTVGDGRLAERAGADAIGLNFFHGSKRAVSMSTAELILGAVSTQVLKVGLFVNAPVDEILATAARLNLDLIQLHGDEPAAMIRQLAPWPVMRAVRCGADPIAALSQCRASCQSAGRAPDLLLVDALVPGSFGGTGKTADWRALSDAPSELSGQLVLAGGLTPDNVADAVRQVRPLAVDTASGVEQSPGVKDPLRLEQFVRQAKSAFEATGRAE